MDRLESQKRSKGDNLQEKGFRHELNPDHCDKSSAYVVQNLPGELMRHPGGLNDESLLCFLFFASLHISIL